MGINTSPEINSWEARRRHSCGISGLQQTLKTPYLRITWRKAEGYGVGAFKNAGLPQWLSSKEFAYNAEDAGDPGSIPGSRLSLGGGHGNPLQYSCLENPVDRGVWWAADESVAESQTPTEGTECVQTTLSHCVTEILRHTFKKELSLSWAGHKELDVQGFFF